jgi:hypothetical protein
MIFLNHLSSSSNPDLGFAANYNDGVYHHTGFFRDASDAGTWKVFENYLPEPDANVYINTAHASFKLAPFSARDARFTGILSVTANTSVGNTTVGGFLKLGGTDIRATFAQNTYVKTTLANTNLRVNLINTNLTGTNTALRTLISDRLQTANASSTYQTKSVERAALANTNLYIATKASWSALTGTNTSLRTAISDRLQVANSRNYLQVANSKTYLQVSNASLLFNNKLSVANSRNYLQVANSKTYLQVSNSTTLFNNKLSVANSKVYLQVANAVSTYLTKNNPIITGSLTANNITGTSGSYLRTSGTGIYWSPVVAGANGFSTVTVGANNAVAASSTSRLTIVAGTGVSVAANPTTDTITFAATYVPRITSVTSTTSPFAINTNNLEEYAFTALANALTINADLGSPVDGQKFVLRMNICGINRQLLIATLCFTSPY